MKTRYVLTNGKWKKAINMNKTNEDAPEKWEYKEYPTINVPLPRLIDEYEDLTYELTLKEIKLQKIKTTYTEKEFSIKYIEDINFKELYGRANDDTRQHHVETVCADLIQQKNDLEISINYLKRTTSLLKRIIHIKTISVPILTPNCNCNHDHVEYNNPEAYLLNVHEMEGKQ